MSRFKIIGSAKDKNLLINPSFELWTGSSPTGWTITGTGSREASPIRALFGNTSLLVFPSSPNTIDFSQVISGLTPGDQITASAFVYITQQTEVWMRIEDATNPTSGGHDPVNAENVLLRPEITYTVPASGSVRVIIRVFSASFGTVYIDGAQARLGAAATNYFDGDTYNCLWLGAPHLSQSETTLQAEGFGEPVDLYEYGGSVQATSGFGAAPNSPITREDAQGNVDLLDNLLRPRTLGLAMAFPAASGIPGLHAIRSQYMELLLPKKGEGQKILRYEPAPNRYLEIPFNYEGGLDAPSLGGLGQAHLEKATIRLTSYNALPYDPVPRQAGHGEGRAAINYSYGLTKNQFGIWEGFGEGLGGAVTEDEHITAAPNGQIWVAIPFISGVNRNYRIYISNGPGSSFVHTYTLQGGDLTLRFMAFAPWGTLFISCTGLTQVVDVATSTTYAATQFGYTNSSNPTALTAITFTGSTPQSITFGSFGQVYVGGAFTAIAGVAANGVAKGTYQSSGTYIWTAGIPGNPAITGGSPTTLATDNTYLYVGGSFTTVAGVAGYTGIMRVTLVDGAIDKMLPGYGFPGVAHDIAIDTRRGWVYATGHENDSGHANYLKQHLLVWKNNNWYLLGMTDPDEYEFYSLLYDPYEDKLWVGGSFSEINNPYGTSYAYPALVYFQGDQVYRPGLELPAPDPVTTSNAVKGMALVNRQLWASYNGTATIYGFSSISLTVEEGNVEPYPIITVQGPGIIRYLQNDVTGVLLNLDYTLVLGEKLIVDTRPGKERVYSSIYGEQPSALHPSANLAGFILPKGESNLYALMEDADVLAQISITYHPTYWSLDG